MKWWELGHRTAADSEFNAAKDAGFEESKHPRDHGKFARSSGGSGNFPKPSNVFIQQQAYGIATNPNYSNEEKQRKLSGYADSAAHGSYVKTLMRLIGGAPPPSSRGSAPASRSSSPSSSRSSASVTHSGQFETHHAGIGVHSSFKPYSEKINHALSYFKPGELNSAMNIQLSQNLGPNILAQEKGGTVYINERHMKTNSPALLASIVYHENIHTTEDKNLSPAQREVRAHGQTASWARMKAMTAKNARDAKDFAEVARQAGEEAMHHARR